MEKREPSYTVGGNVNWCSHYGKQYGGSSKKLKIELPGFPGGAVVESACQCRGHGFEPWSGKIPHATERLGP